MRTLSFHLLREVVATLAMTVAVFTFVLLLGNVLKEILTLLVSRQMSLSVVTLAIGLLIPYVLVFSLPMGLLSSTLLVFGRLSADQELTAMRSSGVSLVSLILPILILSVLLSGLSAAVTLEIAPRCRVAYKSLLYSMGVDRMVSALQPKTFIQDFPGLIVYADEVEEQNLKDVQMYKLDGDGKFVWYIRAEEGELVVGKTNETITVSLRECCYLELGKGSGPVYNAEAEYTTNLVNAPKRRVKVSNMTFTQLRERIKDIEKRFDETGSAASSAAIDAEALARIRKEKMEATNSMRMHLHRQLSFSFACVSFTLIGVPLGIRSHRKETTFGIFLALVLVLIYYSFFVLGDSLKGQVHLHPYLLMWLPNFIFQGVGGFLLWRANRGGS